MVGEYVQWYNEETLSSFNKALHKLIKQDLRFSQK
jgi:hypothetical protein